MCFFHQNLKEVLIVRPHCKCIEGTLSKRVLSNVVIDTLWDATWDIVITKIRKGSLAHAGDPISLFNSSWSVSWFRSTVRRTWHMRAEKVPETEMKHWYAWWWVTNKWLALESNLWMLSNKLKPKMVVIVPSDDCFFCQIANFFCVRNRHVYFRSSPESWHIFRNNTCASQTDIFYFCRKYIRVNKNGYFIMIVFPYLFSSEKLNSKSRIIVPFDNCSSFYALLVA